MSAPAFRQTAAHSEWRRWLDLQAYRESAYLPRYIPPPDNFEPTAYPEPCPPPSWELPEWIVFPHPLHRPELYPSDLPAQYWRSGSVWKFLSLHCSFPFQMGRAQRYKG